MSDDLETLLKKHYARHRMPAERIQAMARDTQRKGWTSARWLRPAMMAAALVVALLISSIMTPSWHRSPLDRVIPDIVKNHRLGGEVDFAAPTLAGLVQAMESQGRQLRLPESVPLPEGLARGRLCSLAGQPSVHIYLGDDAQGSRVSLFVADAEGALDLMEAGRLERASLSIVTWEENGHFYALAKEQP